VSRNPVDDVTGGDCAINQPSDVWFLAGTTGGNAERTCTIPAGRNIYAPMINQICKVRTTDSSAEAIRSCTATVDSATASLDGRQLQPHEDDSRTAFAFTAQANSFTGFTAGRQKAVAWGLWLGRLALESGTHTFVFSARSGTFTTSTTYHLVVSETGNAAS
jgi:hypothetical protein